LIDRLRAGPLGQREFRLLFLGRTTSFIGNAFANVALAFAVLDLTGSKADLGLVLAARSIPRWDTTMQQEIPQEKLSRVYSYDALGSWVLIPLGLAVAGPVAELIGTRETILAATAISLTATLAVLFVRDVRTISRRAD